MTILKIRKRQARERSLLLRPSPPSRPQPIVTWSESAECTCPEHCERDHEHD